MAFEGMVWLWRWEPSTPRSWGMFKGEDKLAYIWSGWNCYCLIKKKRQRKNNQTLVISSGHSICGEATSGEVVTAYSICHLDQQVAPSMPVSSGVGALGQEWGSTAQQWTGHHWWWHQFTNLHHLLQQHWANQLLEANKASDSFARLWTR